MTRKLYKRPICKECGRYTGKLTKGDCPCKCHRKKTGDPPGDG